MNKIYKKNANHTLIYFNIFIHIMFVLYEKMYCRHLNWYNKTSTKFLKPNLRFNVAEIFYCSLMDFSIVYCVIPALKSYFSFSFPYIFVYIVKHNQIYLQICFYYYFSCSLLLLLLFIARLRKRCHFSFFKKIETFVMKLSNKNYFVLIFIIHTIEKYCSISFGSWL